MLEQLDHIKINDIEYPVACNLNVLSIFQDKYGSITKWSETLSPKKGEPKFSDIIFTFKELLNEGIDIENEDKKDKVSFLTEKQVGRLIWSLGITNASNIVGNLVINSTKSDNEEKNVQTTQNQ